MLDNHLTSAAAEVGDHEEYVPTTVTMIDVPDEATASAEVAAMVTVVRSELMLLRYDQALVPSTLLLTERMLLNSALPALVPVDVGYAIASPLLPETEMVPCQQEMLAGWVGAPLATVLYDVLPA